MKFKKIIKRDKSYYNDMPAWYGGAYYDENCDPVCYPIPINIVIKFFYWILNSGGETKRKILYPFIVIISELQHISWLIKDKIKYPELTYRHFDT